jgi:predicted RNA binding protein YcfA (HicA-like mRNA interferase family)
VKILEANDFIKIRQRGSHILMQKRTGNSTITIPIPNHKEIRIGTLKSIIRQSKLSKELFQN